MKNKQIIILVVVLSIAFVGYKVISSTSEVSTGNYQAACRNACESVGWDDGKFNDILNENDGLSNLCDSYYCSDHRPFSKSTASSDQKTFYGYDCKDNCSGHKAGYSWAEDKGITDLDDCGGNSNSFIEGCQAYVEGENNFGNNE